MDTKMNVYVFSIFVILLLFVAAIAGASTSNTIPVGTSLVPIAIIGVLFLFNKGNYHLKGGLSNQVFSIPEKDLVTIDT